MSSANQLAATQTSTDVKEPRDARRRRELIEATIESIGQNGLSGTTVAKVAELAGLSAGIVNFYFRTKDALLLATLEYVDSEFAHRQQEILNCAGDDPVSQLEAIVDGYFDPDACDPSRVAVWTAFWGEARSREAYQRVCGSREEAEERQLVELFGQVANRGGHNHLDSIALGRAFWHLLSSLPENMLIDSIPFDYESAKQTCRGFLASVFPAEFSLGAVSKRARVASLPSAAEAPEPKFDTLPTWIYHNPEFFELENKYIFQRHWLLVGHVSHVPAPGDYMTLDVANERAMVIRGKDNVLRAFQNVCRHRASRVVRDESGNCPGAIVCPYHGWSYGFDGKLRAVPAERTFQNLDKSKIGLPELELEEWMGFVFVRFEAGGQSVASSMKPFDSEAREYRFSEMKPYRRIETKKYDFNWKLFSENDAEGYHIPTGHPGLRRLFGSSYDDDNSSSDGSRAFSVLQDKESPVWTERMYQRLLPEVEHLPLEHRRAWLYYGIFPSAVLQVSPDLVDAYQVLPVSPNECQLMGFSVGLEDDRREMRAARYLNGRIVREVLREDLDFCRWTDTGVRSSGYRGGFLSNLESGVREFHEKIRELIPVASCSDAPLIGRVAAVNEELSR
ncbi:MAG: Rieske 2Fe-2S domain-containing protein [Myxococcales bacterium]|nr:Rieske 2Fe-2S domain-containing protein [Myxococcales bacterium]